MSTDTHGAVYPMKILAALHAVMGSVGYVQKKGENKFHGYKYAGEANLLEVLRPAMVEHGLMLIPSARSRTDIDQFGNMTVDVEYTLAHKDGDVWPEKIVAFGMGNDKNKTGGVGDKGLYKALTGANKYLLFKLFQIETGDDPEKDSEHDKDTTPAKVSAPDVDKVKNPPGRSAAVTSVRELCREVMACEDADQLMALLHLPASRKLAVTTCRDFPRDWMGEAENSGLAGVVMMAAQTIKCPEAEAWVHKAEQIVREAANKQAAE